MGVEVRPLNVLCNIQCLYCYQHPQRDAAGSRATYSLGKIKDAILAEGRAFTLFGGEPLLLPIKDLEELWALGYDEYGHNSLQTNGTLIEDRHYALFHKYNVHVGISMDGPGALNDLRWHGTLERTRESTKRTEHAIDRLCNEGLTPSIIVTLHRGNATGDRLNELIIWVRQLEGRGVRRFRLHLLEVDHAGVGRAASLTAAENLAALRAFWVLNRELPLLEIDLFRDISALLRGDDRRAGCIWKSCDPYTTAAVTGIEGQGQRSNCGRTNKDGIDFIKAQREGFERYIALYHTPQEFGGCRGCRFFLACRGQCPGTAEAGDWRNRSEHCEVWKGLLELIEAYLTDRGEQPISKHPQRSAVEELALAEWECGHRIRLPDLIQRASKQQDDFV